MEVIELSDSTGGSISPAFNDERVNM